MRHCIDEGKLQAWFDEELSAEEKSAVRTHLSACAQCAEAERMMAAENSILAGALAAEFDGAVPSERLRHRIDAAVTGSALVRPQARVQATSTPARPWIKTAWPSAYRHLWEQLTSWRVPRALR